MLLFKHLTERIKMNTTRRNRLYTILALLVGVSIGVGIALFALKQNINLFYTPTQIKNGEAPRNTQIRAGGMVVKNSIVRSKTDLDVSFIVTDYDQNLRVVYNGVLPDLFREGQGIVVLGKLDDSRTLVATQVLAKHDEKYMPPEVADSLEKEK